MAYQTIGHDGACCAPCAVKKTELEGYPGEFFLKPFEPIARKASDFYFKHPVMSVGGVVATVAGIFYILKKKR